MHLIKEILALAGFAHALPPFSEQKIIQDDLNPADLIRDRLVKNKIIPQVLDDFEPLFGLDIRYPHHEEVSLGNTIAVKHLSHRPAFTFAHLNGAGQQQKHRTDIVYTLILTDPDAKSYDNPKWSEMCHWIVTNVTHSAVEDVLTRLEVESKTSKNSGELVKYQPPSPPPKTGPHRYVFVLLEGDGSNTVNSPSERKHWGYGKNRHGVRDWAAENSLRVVGANFFYARNKKQ